MKKENTFLLCLLLSNVSVLAMESPKGISMKYNEDSCFSRAVSEVLRDRHFVRDSKRNRCCPSSANDCFECVSEGMDDAGQAFLVVEKLCHDQYVCAMLTVSLCKCLRRIAKAIMTKRS